MKPSPATELCRRLGLTLLLFVGLTFVIGWLALAVGLTIGPWVAPLALAAAVALVEPRWRVGLPALGIVVAAMVGAALFYDVSWDGQAYHQEAALALAGGWNPLRHGHLPAERFDNLWINHYPKAAWIIEAALLRTAGRLEAAKGLTAILAVGAGFLSYAVLRTRAPRWLAVLTALVLAGHPVVLAQGWSFYVDGMLAALMTALLALAVLPRDRLVLAAEAAAVVVMINLKFTGLIYAAVVLLAHAGLWLFRRRERQSLLVVAASLLAGTLVLGFDPYVRNTLEKGHPFYPIAGPHPVDLLTPHQAASFLQQPRPVRLVVSLFARSSEGSHAPELKAPWSVRADELEAIAFADTRIGGFGPLFGAALLMALGLLPLLPLTRPVLLGGGAILLATLINPGLWWARYVPQVWLLPAGLLAVAVLTPAPGRGLRYLRGALLVLLLADQALVGGAQIDRNRTLTRAIDQQLAVLRQASASAPVTVAFKSFDALAVRLRRHGVQFAAPRVPCLRPLLLVASPAEVCLPDAPLESAALTPGAWR